MIMAKIAINGFGRIGRSTFKAGWGKPGFEMVAVNDLTDPATLAHLLKYDTNYGTWGVSVKAGKDCLIVDGKKVPVFAQKDPAQLPWKDLGIDVVIESTGFFRTAEKAGLHLTAGAKRVIISAPAKEGDVPTYVLGVNSTNVKKEKAAVVNNASCTTNCATPVLAMLEEAFGVKKAMMSTVHGYTADQNLVDGPHADLRRARSAAENIVPTSSGAAEAVAATLPPLAGKFDGYAIRVPVSTVSLLDLTALLKKRVTAEEVNAALVKASKTSRWKGIVQCTNEELVSKDFVGNTHSAIIDLPLTRVVDGDLAKVVAWYDNEWGYSNRLVELALFLGRGK